MRVYALYCGGSRPLRTIVTKKVQPCGTILLALKGPSNSLNGHQQPKWSKVWVPERADTSGSTINTDS